MTWAKIKATLGKNGSSESQTYRGLTTGGT
jgi:hypothetical protein